jgi:hypothetical protein
MAKERRISISQDILKDFYMTILSLEWFHRPTWAGKMGAQYIQDQWQSSTVQERGFQKPIDSTPSRSLLSADQDFCNRKMPKLEFCRDMEGTLHQHQTAKLETMN